MGYTRLESMFIFQYEAEYGSFHKSFGRPGAGAPLRTESGKIKAEMTTAPDIRFQDSQDGKLMLERSLRYKNDDSSKQHYGKALGKSKFTLLLGFCYFSSVSTLRLE